MDYESLIRRELSFFSFEPQPKRIKQTYLFTFV